MAKATIIRDNDGFLELRKDNEVYMNEKHVHFGQYDELINKCHGDVLMLGLGLGSVNEKLDYDKVNSIEIIELHQDIIDLAKAYPKTTILQADARTYETDRLYDVIWIDIWRGINDDTLSDMQQMMNLWKGNLKEGGWIECFGREDFRAVFYQEPK